MPIEVKTTEGRPGDPFRRKVEVGECVLYLADCGDMVGRLGVERDGLAVITDPPTGQGADTNVQGRGVAPRSGEARAVRETSTPRLQWDTHCPALVDVWVGAARWQIVWCGQFYDLGPARKWLVWDKQTGNNHLGDFEMAWTNLPGAPRMKRHLWSGLCRKGNEPRSDHPTQKPIELMAWCIEQLPSDVTVIVDPFMGSGTTLVAAVPYGLSAIGIEQHEPYFDAAVRRVIEAYAQPRLDLPVPPPPAEQLDMSAAFQDQGAK